MVKVYFPNFFMRLLSVDAGQSIAKLHVSPRMTKTEIKEYLTKIYSIDVQKVNTANLLGQWKRLYAKRRVISYKERNVKVAYVHFKPPSNATEVVAK
eukprot:gene36274-44002_t